MLSCVFSLSTLSNSHPFHRTTCSKFSRKLRYEVDFTHSQLICVVAAHISAHNLCRLSFFFFFFVSWRKTLRHDDDYDDDDANEEDDDDCGDGKEVTISSSLLKDRRKKKIWWTVRCWNIVWCTHTHGRTINIWAWFHTWTSPFASHWTWFAELIITVLQSNVAWKHHQLASVRPFNIYGYECDTWFPYMNGVIPIYASRNYFQSTHCTHWSPWIKTIKMLKYKH